MAPWRYLPALSYSFIMQPLQAQFLKCITATAENYHLPIPFQSRVRRLTHVSFCMYNLF
jgi:hypothetical protein